MRPAKTEAQVQQILPGARESVSSGRRALVEPFLLSRLAKGSEEPEESGMTRWTGRVESGWDYYQNQSSFPNGYTARLHFPTWLRVSCGRGPSSGEWDGNGVYLALLSWHGWDVSVPLPPPPWSLCPFIILRASAPRTYRRLGLTTKWKKSGSPGSHGRCQTEIHMWIDNDVHEKQTSVWTRHWDLKVHFFRQLALP